MAAIHSLPFELLALVFEQLYHDPNRKRYGDVELGDPSLFPCAVARVCQLWRDVVAERPEYWEHIVFDLASEEPPFLDAFLWAKEKRFDVLVFDSRYWTHRVEPGSHMSERFTPISADHERALVSAITEALLPHLERCLSLHYSTLFSDSLPEVATILQHNNPQLIRKLRLDYHINNSQVSIRALKYDCDGEAVGRSSFSLLPSLGLLSIDAVALVLLMQQCPQLSKKLFPIQSLEISEYQFGCDHTSEAPSATYNVTDFIQYLTVVSTAWSDLCLRGLSMTACGRHDAEAGTALEKSLTVDVFKAVDLSEDFLRHLFQQVTHVGGRFGHFSGRCNFPVNTPALSFPTLCLHGLPLDANLPRLLAGWGGHHLTFTSCPCFNDALLDTLAEAGPSIEDCAAPCLSVLNIEHCDNFSRGALMNFFVKRNDAAISSSYLKRVKILKVDGIQVEPTAEELALYK